MGFVEGTKKIEGLNLRGELVHTKLLDERVEVMKSVGFVATLENRKMVAISSCEDWISLNRPEALYYMQRRQQHLMYKQEIRELLYP